MVLKTMTHFTLKEQIVLTVLPELVNHQLVTGNVGKKAADELASAAVNIANATIAALEADE